MLPLTWLTLAIAVVLGINGEELPSYIVTAIAVLNQAAYAWSMRGEVAS